MRKNIITTAVMSLVLCAGIPTLSSCSGNTDDARTEHQSAAVPEDEADVAVIHASFDAPENFKSSFQEATEHYLELKDALVASNAAEAKRHAAAMAASLNKTEAAALEGEAARKWNSIAGALKSGASKIAGTTDLAEQRGAFTELSNNMIAAAEAFGAGSTVYRQYCPMANQNTGGSWLSHSMEIRNPYYGDAMLECGEVQAAIQDKQ